MTMGMGHGMGHGHGYEHGRVNLYSNIVAKQDFILPCNKSVAIALVIAADGGDRQTF